jgi:hypothetical protein
MIPTILTLFSIAAAEFVARRLGGRFWLRFAEIPVTA